MTETPSSLNPQQAAAALAWLAEMGAGEIIGGEPIDRFAAPAFTTRSAPATTARAAAPVVTPTVATKRETAPRSAAECQSLDDIRAALEVFEACPLHKTATRLCFADGNPDAHVMLVGEAPGRDEDLAGKPFVGRAGQLLDLMLAAIGLSRHSAEPEKSVFITNTVFWRPPGNRKPTDAENAMCLPYLRRAIELKRPRHLVCVGGMSASVLTGRTDGILKLRGKWFEHQAGEHPVPMLATLHPAYLLRQPGQKRLAWRDLLQLRLRIDAMSPAN